MNVSSAIRELSSLSSHLCTQYRVVAYCLCKCGVALRSLILNQCYCHLHIEHDVTCLFDQSDVVTTPSQPQDLHMQCDLANFFLHVLWTILCTLIMKYLSCSLTKRRLTFSSEPSSNLAWCHLSVHCNNPKLWSWSVCNASVQRASSPFRHSHLQHSMMLWPCQVVTAFSVINFLNHYMCIWS